MKLKTLLPFPWPVSHRPARKITRIVLFLTALILHSAIALSQQTDCATHPNPLIASPAKIEFTAKNIGKAIVVNIQNPTNAPVQLGTLSIDGANKTGFVLLHKDAATGKGSNAKAKENCSGGSISPHGSCSFTVKPASSKPAALSATVHVPVGKCDLVVAVEEKRK